MQHRPVLRDVDVFSGEHGLNLLLQLGLLRQRQQLLHRLLGHALARKVGQDLVVLLEEVVAAGGVPQEVP